MSSDEQASGFDGATRTKKAWLAGLAPDPALTVSEWADRHRVLSSRAASEAGPYRTARTPYMREIMDALSPGHPARRVVFMKAAQVGATEGGNNWIGYCIHRAPGPFLAIQPTVDLASDNHNQNFAGGAGGLLGAPGANGAGNGGKIGTGGTGGGTGSAFGSNGKGWDSHGGGGGGGRVLPSISTTGVGGLGGGPEQAGGNDGTRGGGGGWGAAGGSGQAPGGGAGKAIELNGYSATIIGVQTLIYGPVA